MVRPLNTLHELDSCHSTIKIIDENESSNVSAKVCVFILVCNDKSKLFFRLSFQTKEVVLSICFHGLTVAHMINGFIYLNSATQSLCFLLTYFVANVD